MEEKTKAGKGKKNTSDGETPLMKQYNSIKAKHPDAVLLFRVGDFYETFGSDAVKVSSILGIVLTRRNNGSSGETELAGFPHHALDTYLPRLVKAGNRVAICDQLEDPRFTKTIVKRGVTELVTPGISYNEKTLEQKQNNFLASLYWPQHFVSDAENSVCGVAFLDVSTGDFFVAEGSKGYVQRLIQNYVPSEIIFPRSKQSWLQEYAEQGCYPFALEEWVYAGDYAQEVLTKQLGTASLKGFGIEEMTAGIAAAGAALHYLKETAARETGHINRIQRIEEDRYVWLDKFTLRNLEVVQGINERAVSLWQVMDHTLTPMGSRLLRRWLVMPLREENAIRERHDVVERITREEKLQKDLSDILRRCGDAERLISRAAVQKITPREVVQLRNTLLCMQEVRQLLAQHLHIPLVAAWHDRINPCEHLLEKISRQVRDDAPPFFNKGGIFKEGVDAGLDEYRRLLTHGKEFLQQILERETQRTGISSLKISYNAVFGYYLEVTHTHKDKVPDDWTRKQTLANAERYITQELKEYEEKILHAEEHIVALEQQLFSSLVQEISTYAQPIQHNARVISEADCLHSFAALSLRNGYVKPLIHSGNTLLLKDSRHPVIETLLPPGETYISNDVWLDSGKQQILMITGPNMSGKSALLRQVALVVIMAQCGCFVPATHAEIGLVDKIFTRVGASDNLSTGESTFMVEMNETASILNNITHNSLVILDEIGRGTSTYDGISIAWAIAEFLHENPHGKPRTLFATHYHELNDMERSFSRIHNMSVSVHEKEGKILFLRKLISGGSEHSFGIHVARMAGMPSQVIRRSEEILSWLEKSHSKNPNPAQQKEDKLQLSFFQLDDPVLEQIREQLLNTDINILTPVEALIKLHEIKKLLGK
jgi:DNA mismatch repair protein MutS